jgi:hypothetical protein
MKSTFFCNKKSLEIISPNIKNDIVSLINETGSFNLTSKYYTFLNKKNVNNLKENKFLVSLSTFGKKFILFITKYNTKKYCIFINKKNETMTVTQLKFTDDIFLGTLFDGELVKNDNEKWIFLINDIAYCKGNNIITKPFQERQNIIENILLNEYDYKEDNQSFFISKKNYFRYENIKDLVENYMNNLNYKCSGLYFKNINNFSDNYLFIFPECRSDTKILNNQIENNINTKNINNLKKINLNNKNSIDENENNEDDDKILFGNVNVISNMNNTNKHNKLEKITCRFIIQSTLMPDIYELYCKGINNSIDRYSYAGVPDIEVSNFLKELFINKEQNESATIYVECNYHKNFKKWVPFKKVDTVDTVQIINQTQITLDSI